MNFLVSGYFGYRNAGDEAVLAAMLAHLGSLDPGAVVTATSGAPEETRATHGCQAVGREAFRDILAAMRASDAVLSGGGSLVQDVTSVRNVAYYTGLMRMARLVRRPLMIYAQGVGPLQRPLSQKLARIGVSAASEITVRDPDSADLLRQIGVKKPVRVTADPVWDLGPAPDAEPVPAQADQWLVALRSWPGAPAESLRDLVGALRGAAAKQGKTLRFLPMQPGRDHEILHGLVSFSEVMETTGMSPQQVLRLTGRARVMVAMRLHALIFAASMGVPVVALNYDPKVASLARLIGAPLIDRPDAAGLQQLERELCQMTPPDSEKIASLKRAARLNAELAVALARGGNKS